MFLSSPEDNLGEDGQPPQYPVKFYFSVMIHADYDCTEEYQHATEYTVRSHTCGIVRSHEHGTSFNPVTMFEMTRGSLKRYIELWQRDSGHVKPVWMTALLCTPPTTTITLHLDFLRASLPPQEAPATPPAQARRPLDPPVPTRPLLKDTTHLHRPYKTARTISQETAFTIGHLLSAIYEHITWPALRFKVHADGSNTRVKLLPNPHTPAAIQHVAKPPKARRFTELQPAMQEPMEQQPPAHFLTRFPWG